LGLVRLTETVYLNEAAAVAKRGQKNRPVMRALLTLRETSEDKVSQYLIIAPLHKYTYPDSVSSSTA